MVEELNRASAQSARESGESFVATPVGQRVAPSAQPIDPPKRTVRDEFKEVPMAPQPLSRGVEPKAPPPPVDETSNLVQSLIGDLKGVGNPSPGNYVTISVSLKAKDNVAPKPPEPSIVGPEIGSLLYAVTTLAVNSDLPTPVAAKVVGGAYKGARLLGAFQLQGGLLSITFNQIIYPDGRAVGIQAVAVDARTSSPAINGRVDNHFLERWGALMAASFLEGFGQAMSNRGTTVHAYGDVVVADRGHVSTEDVSLEALGRVGSRASSQLEKGFDRPPTVSVPAGSPIGVLVVGLAENTVNTR
jgi:hypothetical protein